MWNTSGTRTRTSGRFRISEVRVLPRLYPILDTRAFEAHSFDLPSACAALLNAGVRMLQYRHKDLFTEERFEEARKIAHLCSEAGAMFIMNDRADFAQLLGCGVHLGQDDLPAASARALLGSDFMVGLSTHNEKQFREALQTPIDYVALGPIFGTQSKSNPDPEVGLPMITRLRELTNLPLVAIGGINQEDAPAVIESGADVVAVISALLPNDPGNFAALEKQAAKWVNAVR